ncbi:MAG: hypothetical protein WBZ05_10870 [Desulfobacterales bacterium]
MHLPKKVLKILILLINTDFVSIIFLFNAFDIQAVWRGILLHRGNMPQQGGAVEGCQKRIYFLLNDQNLRAKTGKRKEETGKRISETTDKHKYLEK